MLDTSTLRNEFFVGLKSFDNSAMHPYSESKYSVELLSCRYLCNCFSYALQTQLICQMWSAVEMISKLDVLKVLNLSNLHYVQCKLEWL